MGRRTTLTRAGTYPNFLIIGALRSGTTSLARHLGAHPEVFMAPPKELRYFDRGFHKGSAWYRRQFSGAGAEPAIGEATPTYMYGETALTRMAALVPEARLIAILRNPVDRAYSHFWLNRARGAENLDFSRALGVEARRLERGELRYAYMDHGRYLPYLRRVCTHFPRGSLHVLLLDDLQEQPAETYRTLCGFLDIDQGFVPSELGRAMNRYVGFRSPALRKATRGLPPPLRRVVGRLNAQSSSYPPLDPRTRSVLSQRFEPDNADLATWLGRDLSVWAS